MKSLISFSEKSYMMRRSLRISLISFIEKSWLSFKGTVIVFFEDSGKSLIVFSEKSCGNPKGRRETKEIPYRLYRKILYE